MSSRLVASLRQAPVTIPALAALALFVVLATGQAGYPLTHWAPVAIVVLALLCIALGALGWPLGELPVAVRVALAALAAYAALSFLSILWADVPADAWEGANRTLLYLVVFALFACWRQHGGSAALLLCAWVFAIAVLAAVVALHVDAASNAGLRALMPSEGRLTYPSGYANANAALWLIAAWPAVLLVASPRLPWALRGGLAAAAVLLASVALLSQSRGAFYATPVMLVLVFALLPGRLRNFAALLPVAAGVAATAPAVLRVGNRLDEGYATSAHVHGAVAAIFVAAAVVGLIVAAAAALESRRTFSEAWRRRARVGLTALAIATVVGLIAGGWAAAGDPAARIRHAWETFKSPRGYAANGSGGRLTSGLGSSRYDFYRVSLDEFVAHPLVGIGADNFQQQYLVHGRSSETPHYPHSIELRTLAETGVVGSLLAVIGLVAALVAALRAARARADPLAATAAAAALSGFAYWLVHGSFDWFFEFAGLGAPAFALLGIACALDPRRAVRARAAGAARLPRRVALAAGGAAAVAAALSLGAPWLSGLEADDAASIWPRAPLAAYARLDNAAKLNPLSDQPYLTAGSIALRFGDLARAASEFSRALRRVPHDAYATLELGAIASQRGERAHALALLERASALRPRDPITRRTLAIARTGARADIAALNRAILEEAQHLR